MTEETKEPEQSKSAKAMQETQVALYIGECRDGMRLQVQPVGAPMSDQIEAHAVAKWISDNFDFILRSAMSVFDLQRELAQAHERATSKPKLIAPDGSRLN